MKKQQLLKYINLFREKGEKGKLIIFVGAGVSCNVEGMPSWYDLIKKMAQAIGYTKCSFCKHKKDGCAETCLLAEDYSTDEFLKIPQYVYNKDRNLYDKVLKDNIHDVKADAPLSYAIFDINPVHIITTNYDKLLESSKNEFCEQYQVVVNDKDLLNAEKSKYIIKMHGDLSQPENIVLKEQDYLDYSQKHVLIELFVKSLLTDHTLLFLGYSLNDYNIKLIISWLNYMRSKNDALNDGQKVGYIVLDDDQIDNIQVSYFAGNNIGVININGMPYVNDMPGSLSNEKGKRLYSFLRVIADPSLEEGLAIIENTVRFMSEHAFVDYQQILKLLYIKEYEKNATELRLFSEEDYNMLVQFISTGNSESSQLKQLFINAGVLSMLYLHDLQREQFIIGDLSESSLLHDRLYKLYIENKYDEIKSLLKNDTDDLIKKCFYQSIISGYTTNAFSDYRNIIFSTLSLEQKVAYLHNTEVLKSLQQFKFDSSKVKHFIENISSSKEKDLFLFYLDIYNGNSKKLLHMKKALDKLKKSWGTSYPQIYKIKNFAMTQYLFYYYNHIFYEGLSDTRTFFKSYIEAIICANCEQANEPSYLGSIRVAHTKYFIEYIDFDIITKFVSTKDLSELLNNYKIIRLNTSNENIVLLTKCFRNLCNSLINAQTYGFQNSSFTVLANLSLLLNFVELSKDCKKIIANSIVSLFSDEYVCHFFFSIRYPDFRCCLNAFSSLCKSLYFSPNFQIIKKIVTSKNFFEYAVNVSFGSLRQLIVSLLPNDDKCVSIKIQAVIDMADNFQQKIILLRLFYHQIADETSQKTYQDFLALNFLQLSTDAIYDFVFSGWLTPAPETAEAFLNGILRKNEERPRGVHSFPDPVETKLECAYLMYINDIITDISILKELAEGRPHLQFLLNQETFDYTQVDFSNYMWENFARHEKFMTLFVKHKDHIIPQIKAKINKGEASEAEKKILFGFLLNSKEIWEV